MYCPKCSHKQSTDTVRFCSRCGFQLDLVKDLLASEDSGEFLRSLQDAKRLPLRQVDILVGAAFMLIGAIKAVLITSNIQAPGDTEIIYGLFFLSFGFALFLLFVQLSHRQRGLTLGATLIFLGTLVALPAFEFFGMAALVLIAVVLLPIIFFWTKLAGVFMKTFFDKDVLIEKPAPALPEPAPAITSSQPQHSVSVAGPKRLKTADLVQPPSVTEETTSLLDKS